MPAEYPYIDATNNPDALSRAAKEVAKSRRSQLVKIGDDEMVQVSPAEPVSKTRKSSRVKHQPIPADDPIFKIIGMVKTDGPTDVGRNKHKYLVETYYAEFHPPKDE